MVRVIDRFWIESRKLDPNRSLQINNLSSLKIFFFEQASPIIHFKSHLPDILHVSGALYT